MNDARETDRSAPGDARSSARSHTTTRRDDVQLDRTPVLAAALARLFAAVTRAIWLEGLGRAALALGVGVGLFFLADWTLDLPRAVRLLALAALVVATALTVGRRLVRPLRARPGATGLAVLLERDLDVREELLVSAVDLQRAPDAGASPLSRALVERVFERAERAAAGVDVARLLDHGPARRRGALGALALALAALPLVVSPLAGVFLARLVGSDLPWPRRTTLELEIVSGAIVENPGSEELRLLVPRGGDVALAVRAADGSVTPERVQLSSASSVPQMLDADGTGTFRALLRSVTKNDRIAVRGGDDDDGRPNATITVVDPPDLAGLVIEVVPPTYTDLPAQRYDNTGATALVGSSVRLWAATSPPDANATLALLPTDEEIAPERRAAPDGFADVLGDEAVLFHSFTMDQSLRLRFDLTDARGLATPDPALFALDAVEDRPPEIVRLVPSRSDVETSGDGAVRAVLAVRDDFGVDDVTWTARAGGDDGPILATGRLEPLALPEGADGEWHATLRIEVADLLGPERDVGSQIAVAFEATDRARPPQVGRDDSLRVRVLGRDELMRRVKDRLARTRTQASTLSERLVETRRRAEELALLVAAADVSSGEELSGLRTALALARRAESDGRAIVRELTAVCELVLYARLDDKAGRLLEALDRELADRRSRTFDAEPWRAVIAAHEREALAVDGFATHLVSIAALALELMDGPLADTAGALDDATAARDAEVLAHRVDEASDAARDGALLVEALLERLSEWDNYQSVLSLTRDLLERQKTLSERTRRFAADR